MIAFLEGRVVHATPLSAVIVVNGIGYEVFGDFYTENKCHDGSEQITSLWIHTVHSESAGSRLIGFYSLAERDFFRSLLTVDGVGSKTAQSIASSMSMEAFGNAIRSRKTTALQAVKGVGKKTAERIVLEFADQYPEEDPAKLEEKLGRPLSMAERVAPPEAHRALVGMGWTAQQVKAALAKASKSNANDCSLEGWIRTGIRELA